MLKHMSTVQMGKANRLNWRLDLKVGVENDNERKQESRC